MTRKLAKRIAEVAADLGATATFEEGSKHDRINLRVGDRTRFVVCSHSPSDVFAEKCILGDVRRAIRKIAA